MRSEFRRSNNNVSFTEIIPIIIHVHTNIKQELSKTHLLRFLSVK